MSSKRLARELAILFVAVLALYLGAFYGIEHLRSRKGPWEVTFATNRDGRPVVAVSQRHHGIARFDLVFPEENPPTTNLPATITFNEPQKTPFEAPFGRVIYEDLTFKPGAVTFDLFGHEIELLPRTLIVNRREHPWQSEATLTLWKTNKVPAVKAPAER